MHFFMSTDEPERVRMHSVAPFRFCLRFVDIHSTDLFDERLTEPTTRLEGLPFVFHRPTSTARPPSVPTSSPARENLPNLGSACNGRVRSRHVQQMDRPGRGVPAGQGWRRRLSRLRFHGERWDRVQILRRGHWLQGVQARPIRSRAFARPTVPEQQLGGTEDAGLPARLP